MTKIDITSTSIEKGIDLIKDFVEKFLGSSIEEAGLFMADNIKLRRFKNQITILNKAQKIVTESGINVKQISLKNLVPLLEYSSLEEEETLQDKWANLLVNFIDNNEKYESIIFPTILSQMSSREVYELERLYKTTINTPYIQHVNSVEVTNMIRLGLIQTIDVTSNADIFTNLRLEFIDYLLYEQSKLRIYVITDLGRLMVECCSSKNSTPS